MCEGRSDDITTTLTDDTFLSMGKGTTKFHHLLSILLINIYTLHENRKHNNNMNSLMIFFVFRFMSVCFPRIFTENTFLLLFCEKLENETKMRLFLRLDCLTLLLLFTQNFSLKMKKRIFLVF